ncbi:MAG TPA: hypothetical protein VM582_02430, partial [Candidatus Thermoplasmatota archaeon]|nr:hypothetical protein [Candidatus Thermoplasmatota archaeon]
MTWKKAVVALTCSSALALEACSGVVGTALNAASNKAGEVVGEAVGKAIVRHYTPQFLQWYTGYLFGLAFHSGGYEIGETPYKVGEWTKWQVKPRGDEKTKSHTIERAFLGVDKAKNQFWRVRFTDGETNQVTTLEGQFDPQRTKLLRMRAKYPDDKEPREVPVNESTYYVPPAKMTKESLQGATVGTESVTTPAGTFSARHVRYNPGGVVMEWWLVQN